MFANINKNSTLSVKEFEVIGLYLLNKISSEDACKEIGISEEQLNRIKTSLSFTLKSEISKSNEKKLEEYFDKVLSLHEQ